MIDPDQIVANAVIAEQRSQMVKELEPAQRNVARTALEERGQERPTRSLSDPSPASSPRRD